MRGYARSFYAALTGSRAAVLTVIVATVLSSWTAQPARAHLFPPDLAFYGPFGGPTVRCQRALGHAAQRCFRRVLTAKRLCMDAELAGGTCDRSARDAEVSAAQQDGQDAVVQACLGGQLTELRFIGFDEAKMDVARTCGDQTDAAMSVLYAPVLNGGSTAAVAPTVSRCLTGTAGITQRLLQFILQLKMQALDHMAFSILGPSRKNAMMAKIATRINTTRAQVITRIQQLCPAFESAYQHDTATVLGLVEPRANCVIGAVYVQTSVACPLPVCGNGVKESGEGCDDGNRIDDDSCHNDCTTNP